MRWFSASSLSSSSSSSSSAAWFSSPAACHQVCETSGKKCSERRNGSNDQGYRWPKNKAAGQREVARGGVRRDHAKSQAAKLGHALAYIALSRGLQLNNFYTHIFKTKPYPEQPNHTGWGRRYTAVMFFVMLSECVPQRSYFHAAPLWGNRQQQIYSCEGGMSLPFFFVLEVEQLVYVNFNVKRKAAAKP